MPKAKAAALKALALDDTLAEAHTSLALVTFFYDWDWTVAEREFRRAIELNPNYATAHHVYAILLTAMQRSDESIAEVRRALEADPLSLPVNNIVGLLLQLNGRGDEAIEQYRKTLEMDPTFAEPVTGLANAYVKKGLEAEAREQFLKAAALSGLNVPELRRAYDVGGLRGLREHQARAHVRAGWDGWHWSATDLALSYAVLGRRDEAMKLLEKAYAARSGSLVWIGDDDWRLMRSDPRFQDLLRRIGLP